METLVEICVESPTGYFVKTFVGTSVSMKITLETPLKPSLETNVETSGKNMCGDISRHCQSDLYRNLSEYLLE